MQASPVPALATPARGVCCSQAPGDDTGRRIGTAAVVYVNESSSRALYNWSSAVHRQLLLQHTFWSCNTWASQRDTAGSHNISTAPSTSLEPVGAAMPPRAAQSLLLLWRDAATPQVLHPPCPRPARTARASASVHKRPVSASGRKCLQAASGWLPARTAVHSRLRAASSALCGLCAFPGSARVRSTGAARLPALARPLPAPVRPCARPDSARVRSIGKARFPAHVRSSPAFARPVRPTRFRVSAVNREGPSSRPRAAPARPVRPGARPDSA